MDTNLINWLIFAACLGPSFLLSGMEAGVFALNRLRVRRLARAGKPSAKLLHGFLQVVGGEVVEIKRHHLAGLFVPDRDLPGRGVLRDDLKVRSHRRD